MVSNQKLNQFNSLMSQLQNSLICDEECQKEKKTKLLKFKWDTASANLIAGPNIEQNAEKNYVTFTQGEAAYNELLENKLREKGTEIAKDYEEAFKKLQKKINIEIHSYNSILLNFKNVVDLYLKYKEENIQLAKELKDTSNDILTNERKTYYKDEEIHHLKFYYYHIILIIYIICVLFFGFISLVYPSKSSWKTRLATFIGLIILPFFSTYIFGLILYLHKAILNALPQMIIKNKFFSFS
jgi:hypothetical protein